jgi:hypothetical protein
MHKIDVAISAQGIDHRIQRVPDNAVAPLYTRIDKHLPQYVRHLSGHQPHTSFLNQDGESDSGFMFESIPADQEIARLK